MHVFSQARSHITRCLYPRYLAWFFVLGLPTTLQGADTRLDEVVVTATQRTQSVREVPAAASVIRRDEIEAHGFDNVLDMMRETPGVSLIGRGTGGRKNISLRGMDGRHTLFLINGLRIITTDDWVGHSDYQYDWMPADGIERVEIVRGPMSVLYGSDALGGVVNVLSQRPQKDWSSRIRLGGKWADGSDGGDSLSAGATVSGGLTEQVRLLVAASVQDQDARAKRQDQQISEADGKDIRSGHLWLSWEPVHGHQLDLEYRHVDEARHRDDRRGEVVFHDVYDIEKQQTVLSWQGEWGDVHTQLRLWESEFSVSNTRTNGIPPTRSQSLDEQALDGRVALPMGARQFITLGFDTRREQMHNAGFDKGRDDATFRALYLQDEIEITEAWLLTLGMRHDHHSGFGSQTSPRAYLIWHVDDQWSLRTGYGEGFKAPTLKQGSREYVAAEGPHIFYGNAAIKPETSQSFELGVIYVQGRIDWEATVFYTQVKDLITVDPIGMQGHRREYLYKNLDQAKIQGLETALRLQLTHGFYLRANAQLLDTEDTTTGRSLNARPDQSLNASLGWSYGSLDTHLRLEHTGRQYLDAQRVPAYELLHAGLGYRINPRLKFNAGIDNINDVNLAARSPLFNYSETPRMLRFAVHASF